ncbi:MAG: hypothetical protein P4L46_10575 [Fimbriimonas sp.]|nr:hypothetical protein [Fimbriimonas sp.]
METVLRFLAAGLYLGVIAPTQSPGNARPVTITIQASAVSKALKQLGALIGTPLSPSRRLSDEIISMRFQDVPVADAMKRVADVLDATWQKEGSGYRLVRTPEQDKAEERIEFEARVERFRKGIQATSKRVSSMSSWSTDQADQLSVKVEALLNGQSHASTPNYRLANQLTRQLPIARAVQEIVAHLDPNNLAALPPYIDTVWSSRPTPIQTEMPSSTGPIFEEYQREQADWVNALRRRRLPTNTSELQALLGSDFSVAQGIADQKVDVILLKAHSSSPNSFMTVTMSAFNASGKRLGQAECTFGGDYDAGFASAMRTSQPSPPGEKKIELEGDGKILMESQMPANRASGRSLPTDLIAKIAHPDRSDPLSLMMSPPLVQAAEAKQLNLIACLADQNFYSAAGTRASLSVSDFLLRSAYPATSIETRDGWITVRPNRPVEAREARADRRVLGQYLRRLLEKRRLSIEDRAAYSLLLPAPDSNSMPAYLARFLRIPATNFDDDINVLRFYGLLTAQQRSRLMADRLPIGSLRPDQAEYVRRMVYGSDGSLEYRASQTVGSEEQELHTTGILSEATESLPTGLPVDGSVSAKADDSFVAFRTDEPSGTSGDSTNELAATDLAWRVFVQDHPLLFPRASSLSPRIELAKLKFARRLQMTFTFQFTPRLFLIKTLEDSSAEDFLKSAQSTMPEDFKKQLDREYESLTRAYAGAKPGQGVEPVHPPP